MGRDFPLKPLSGRRIEVYGDSVSAGEVSEAVDCVGKEDPVHNGGYSNKPGIRMRGLLQES